MNKNSILTFLMSMLAVSIGFTSCNAKNKSQATTADSTLVDSSIVFAPDTALNHIPVADSSWEAAAETFSKVQESPKDTTTKVAKKSLGTPKVTPLKVNNPLRPPELMEGINKARKGDLRGAITDFDLCIANNNKNYNAYFYKAKALLELNEPQNALPNLNLAIEHNPENAMFYYYRGKLYFDSGNTPDAVTDFEKAISLKPNFPDALNYRGVTYELKGKHAEAIADYKLAIAANPGFSIAYYNKGTSEAAMGLYADAITSFSSCLELDAKKTSGYMNRGNCYFMIQDYKSAINDYSSVISANPKYSEAYYNRGAAYQFIGDKNACSDWQKAQSLGNKKAVDMLKAYCK